MKPLERWWSALEEIPGPAAVSARWQELLHTEYDLVRPYLRPRAELAMSFPKPGRYGFASPYRVVQHGPEDIVGVCDETDETIVLTRNDLVIFELARRKLAIDLAAAFGFSPGGTAAPGIPSETLLVGIHEPLAGYSFPAYLTVPLEGRSLLKTICTIISVDDRPFILFAPTGRRLHPEGLAILEKKNACFIALANSLVLDDSGQWEATDAARLAIQRFNERHVPTPETGDGVVFFPTPAGVTWADLSIRFVDGHSVTVRVGAAGGKYHYAQMGMADGRNTRPTKQWELLQALARNHGVLTWKSPDAGRKNKKRRELLARDLKAFFRLGGEPIVATDDGKGWQTIFALSADD